MRVDRLLCYLRFVKTRSQARLLVDSGHIRCDGIRVIRASQMIELGSVLTLPIGRTVRIVKVLALPERRSPAAEARRCYRDLDPRAEGP